MNFLLILQLLNLMLASSLGASKAASFNVGNAVNSSDIINKNLTSASEMLHHVTFEQNISVLPLLIPTVANSAMTISTQALDAEGCVTECLQNEFNDMETITVFMGDDDKNQQRNAANTTNKTIPTPIATTETTKTPLVVLKETEKELKEKIAEIEAEPLILSARV